MTKQLPEGRKCWMDTEGFFFKPTQWNMTSLEREEGVFLTLSELDEWRKAVADARRQAFEDAIMACNNLYSASEVERRLRALADKEGK